MDSTLSIKAVIFNVFIVIGEILLSYSALLGSFVLYETIFESKVVLEFSPYRVYSVAGVAIAIVLFRIFTGRVNFKK